MTQDAGTVRVFTDGGCLGNPGPGGWGVLLREPGGAERELAGGEAQTTNNRMELLAAIVGLEALAGGRRVEVVSDSEYVVKGMTEWMPGWVRRRWKDVKNRDLWERLARAAARHARVDWTWVRGHAGHAENERVDKLANDEARAWARGRGRPTPAPPEAAPGAQAGLFDGAAGERGPPGRPAGAASAGATTEAPVGPEERLRREGERRALARLLTKRFGPLPAEAARRIAAADEATFDAWLGAALGAARLEDVLAAR